jgi:hypothetical protein
MLCGEARSPEYEAVHTRRIFFIAGEYWLIIDSLRGNVSHKFDLRFHLTPEAWNHCASLKESDNAIIRTPDMALVFESHLDPKVEMGWVSPLYGIKREAPVVSVVDHNRDADFFTLITPLKLESKLPRLRVVSPASQSLANGLVEISAVGPNQNGVDTIAWGSQCKALSFPETSLNTSAAWRRTSNEGRAPGAKT